MADFENLGDIQESYEHISAVLEAIRAQNAMKSSDLDKMLAQINVKLEELAGEDKDELVRVFFTEMQNTLEERHKFVTGKFKKVEQSFEELSQKASEALKGSEIRELFDIIATNLSVFSKEVTVQKELLSDITLKIEEAKNDDSQKRDILRNISVLKVELEKFNNGFESIVINLSDNFKLIFDALLKLDTKSEFEGLKKDIDNVFLSSNAVLSTLQMIDHKNRDLEKIIKKMVSKEDFEIERNQVANLIAQNIQIAEYITGLADKAGMAELVQKVDTSVGIINALKNVLTEKSSQNQEILLAQLEQLQNTASSIISEEDFSKFRAELFRLTEEGIQTSNLVRAELLDTNGELKKLFGFLSSFEIRDNFQQLSTNVKAAEDNVKASIWELSGKFSQEAEQYKNLITGDINGNIQGVVQKLDYVQENLKDHTRDSVIAILENIQSVINKIDTVKKDLHFDNQESIEVLEGKIGELNGAILASKDLIAKGNQEEVQKIAVKIEELSQKLFAVKDELLQNTKDGIKISVLAIEKSARELTSAMEEIKQNASSNLETITGSVDSLSQKIDGLGQELNTSSQQNASSIIENIEKISGEIQGLKGAVDQSVQASGENIVDKLYEINALFGTVLKDGLRENNFAQTEGIKESFGELIQKLEWLKEAIRENSKENFSEVYSMVEKFAQEVNVLKESFSQNAQEQNGNISASMDTISRELGEIKAGLGQNTLDQAQNIANTIEKFLDELSQLKGDLNQHSQVTSDKVIANISESAAGLETFLNDRLRENQFVQSENLKENFEEFTNDLNLLKDAIRLDSEEKRIDIVSNLDRITERLSASFLQVKDMLTESEAQNTNRVLQSVDELSSRVENLIKELLKENEIIQSENAQINLDELSKKLEWFKDAIKQNSQEGFSNIFSIVEKFSQDVDHLKEHIDRNSHEKSSEILLNLSSVSQSVSDGVNQAKDELKQTSYSNLENILNTIQQQSEGIKNSLRDSLRENNLVQSEDLKSEFEGLVQKIEWLKNSLSENNDLVKDEMRAVCDSVIQDYKALKDSFEQSSQDNLEHLTSFVERVSQELTGVKNGIFENSQMHFDNTAISIEKITEKLENSIREELNQNVVLQNEVIETNFEGLYGKIEWIKENLSQVTDGNFEEVKFAVKDFTSRLNSIKESLEGRFQINLDNIVSNISEISSQLEMFIKEKFDANIASQSDIMNGVSENLSNKISEIKSHLNNDLKNALDDVKNSVLSIPSTVRDNQSQFENEKTALIEQNSRNIEDLAEKIQVLTKGILNKDNLFKEGIVMEVATFRTALESVKEELKTSDSEMSEEVKANLQNIESILVEAQDDYEESIEELQAKFVEYVDLIQSKIGESDSKLEISFEKIRDLKNDLESVLRNMSSIAQKSDGVTKDLTDKLEDVVLNINQLEENISSKNIGYIQNAISTLEEKFENVLNKAEENKLEIKNYSNGLLQEQVNKIETVKEQLDSVNVEIQNAFKFKAREIIEGFTSVKSLIEDVSNFDLNKVALDVKEYVEIANTELSKSLSDNLGGKNAEISQKLTDAYENLCSKLDEKNSDSEDGIEELKSLLSSILSQVDDISEAALTVETVEELIENASKEIKNKVFEIKENIDETMEISERKIIEEISETKESVVKAQQEFKSDILKSFDEFSSVKESILQSQNDLVQGFESRVDALKTGFFNKFDEMGSRILETQSQANSEIVGAVEKGVFGSKEVLEEVVAAKSELLDGISNVQSSLGQVLNLKDSILETQEEFIKDFESNTEALKTDLLDKFDDTGSRLIETQSEIKAEVVDAVEKGISVSKEVLEEIISAKSELLEGISGVQTSFEESASSQTENIKKELEALIVDINKTQESLADYKLDIAELLKVNDEEFKSKLESIENTIAGEISQNIESFKDTIRTATQEIEGKIALSEENYKTSTQSLLSEIKTSFTERVEDTMDELKSFMEVFESRNDISASVDTLKDNIMDQFSELSGSLEDSIQSLSVKAELDDLQGEIKDSVNDLLENVYDRIYVAIEENKLTKDVFDKTEEVARRIEDLKNAVTEDVTVHLDTFGLSLDRQKEEFGVFIEDVKTSLAEMKDSYIDLSVNSSMEISNSLTSIEYKINSLEEKFENIDFKDVIEGSKEHISSEIASLKETFETGLSSINLGGKISEELEAISQKLDVFALNSDNENEKKLDEVLEEIKGKIEEQSKFLEDLKALEQLENLSKIDGVVTAQAEIKKILAVFGAKLKELTAEKPETKEEALDVKADLDEMKKEIVESVISVFDQISFVVEAEDIKEFVEEKSEEVKNEIKESLGNNFNDILSSLDALHEKSGSTNGNLTEIKQEIEDVKKHLCMLQSLPRKAEEAEGGEEAVSTGISLESFENLYGDSSYNFKSVESDFDEIKNEIEDVKSKIYAIQDSINTEEAEGNSEEYTYTLQDVETDIAKIRLILNELVSKKEEQPIERESFDLGSFSGLEKLNELDKLNEDIVSISTRTNKLLLTSDESYNTLKENLNDFKGVVYKLDEKMRYMDTRDLNKRIESKLENVNNLVMSSVQSDKIFNQALMYLAEWVDTASENMTAITEQVEKVSEIESIKGSIAEIKKNMPKKSETATLLDEISEKFEKQQEKIESLEEKIEKLAQVKKSKEPDIKSIVEEVISQLGLGEGESDDKLTKKVEKIERQLSKISGNIEKLTSYVD